MLADVRETYKPLDAWWTVLLVDPVASRLAVPLANRTNITPNQISLTSFAIGLIAAYAFYLGSAGALAAGAVLYHLSFILDCIDGKIARLKGSGTMFGVVLDIMLDHLRVVICGAALAVGQFQLTGEVSYLFIVLVFTFAYLFRHLNALQLYKVRRLMGKKLEAARREREAQASGANPSDTPPSHHDAGPAAPLSSHSGADDAGASLQRDEGNRAGTPDGSEADAADVPQTQPGMPPGAAGLQKTFHARFPWFLKVRSALERHRIRTHLFSGIEFQMFAFIVAPLAGFIWEAMFYGAVLLLLFEAAVIYKLVLSTRDFEREVRGIRGTAIPNDKRLF